MSRINKIYNYLKSKDIDPSEIFDYLIKEEGESEWLYNALINICLEYGVLGDKDYVADESALDIGKELINFFAYDYDSMLEELLPKLPSSKLEDALTYFAASYGIDIVDEINYE